MAKNTMRATPAQLRVLKFIIKYQDVYKYPPTRSEISEHFGWQSPNAAETHVKLLRKKGYISITPMISRGIKVLKSPF